MTDAIKAGEKPARAIPAIAIQIGGLMFIHYVAWPFLRDSVFWPSSKDDGTLVERTWIEFGLQWLLYISMFIVLILVLIYQKQEGMLYVPSQPFQTMSQNPPGFQSPTQMGMKFEDVHITASDGIKLHGWLIYAEKDAKSKDTIVFMHENAGNIGLRLQYFQLLHKQMNFNVMCVAYRGYSDSQGTPTESGIKLDALAMTEYIRKSTIINRERVFLLGRSLGGAVALSLIQNLDSNGDQFYKGVIIENTFTSISEMADSIFPFFKSLPWLKKLMLKLNWDSLACVKSMKTPVLFITGDRDNFVPTEMTVRLYLASTSKQKILKIVPNGDHNTTVQMAGKDYITWLQDFVKQCNKDNKN